MAQQLAPQHAAPQPGTIAGLPVDLGSLFPEPDGFFARKHRKRRTQVIERAADALRKALVPGEVIRFASGGYRYSGWEYYFAGLAAYLHNQVSLVLTDRRLFVFHVRGHIKSHVALSDVRDSSRRFGRLKLELGDGSKLVFTSVPGVDGKQLAALMPGTSGPLGAAPALEPLCPACLVPVPGPVGETLTCPSPTCRIPFRDPKRAARLSGLVPGLGDLYLGHHFFGSLEFLGSMAALGLGVGMLAQGVAAPTIFALVFLIGLPRAVDYPLTRYMGKKGLVPLALKPAPGGLAPHLPMYPRWAVLLFAAGIAIAGAIAYGLFQVPGME